MESNRSGGETKITRAYLKRHRYEIFVFGDNLLHKGYGGAAKLRDMPNTYGFVTKKAPNNNDGSFYKPEEYKPKFQTELAKLERRIEEYDDYIFLISRLGGGLANRYNIFQEVIKPGLECLKEYPNVRFLL